MAFCTKCGTKIEEGVLFCTNCGNRIGDGISAVQSSYQNSIPPAEGLSQNSVNNTVNTTATCQGCLLNGGAKCTYYDCIITEAEKYDCGIRGVLELQKKQKNNRVVQYFFELGLYALYGWLILARISILLGTSFWVIFVPGILIAYAIEHFIKQNIYKRRRENAKRLS